MLKELAFPFGWLGLKHQLTNLLKTFFDSHEKCECSDQCLAGRQCFMSN